MRNGQIILAFDPGLRCGWASHATNDKAPVPYGVGVISPDEVVQEILKFNRTLRLGLVVVEDFLGAGRGNRYGRMTILTVGRIMGACEALRIPCKIHGSQTMAPFIGPAERLLARRHKQHPDDDVAALAHLLAEEAMQKVQH